MKSILMSIRPQYAQAILDGTKLFEYRRRGPVWSVMGARLFLYATAPVSAVIGEAGAVIWHASPEIIWQHTKHAAGIAEQDFFLYFIACEIGDVFEIVYTKRYAHPKPLSDFGVSRPPQSWRYLDMPDAPMFAEVTT
jgi:predicted transcriptional regulator